MESTRERIINAAVRLFNEQGTGAVSTNHIAAAAGISPGNLYYHFRNKEEIIRAILGRMQTDWAAVFQLPGDRMPSLTDMLGMFSGNFTVLRDYRFFYRELVALMQNDPALSAAFQQESITGLANTKRLMRGFIAAGVLLPIDEKVVHDLAQLVWLIGDFWLPFAELFGDPVGDADVQRGAELMLRVLRPYLSESALAELAADGVI